jgi:hypothetical protein
MTDQQAKIDKVFLPIIENINNIIDNIDENINNDFEYTETLKPYQRSLFNSICVRLDFIAKDLKEESKQ